MIELGKRQKLIVVNIKPHGAYLGETGDAAADARVLLPAKQVPEGAAKGCGIEVFVYRDSDDRLIATTDEPLIELHKTAVLKVRDVTSIGAFLDWGLPKDLLLPFKEQTRKLKAGDEVLAVLYVDRSNRLAATMKVYPYLRTDSPYIPGAVVSGWIYQITEAGAFAAVDRIYSGLIPASELPSSCREGDELPLRVTAVKEDGKLDLAVRDKAYIQMDEDAESVFTVITEDFGGVLPFDDKADPERIRSEFGLSKAAFKRAVGKLYKERRIVIEEGRITSVKESSMGGTHHE